MVKKLIKYDFRSYFRLLLPVQLIMIGFAAINRFIQLFENTDSNAYNIIFTSSCVLYGIAIATSLVMTVIVSIIRFYQGMYTKEGYLNHTLPVTPTQHIVAKLLTSLLFYLGTLFAVFISFIVITLGEVNIELFKAGGYLLKKWIIESGGAAAAYIFEGIILALAARVTTFLKYYFCISVGQLVSKKRILLAFGVYFGLYTLSQIISTVCIIIGTFNYKWIEDIFYWLGDHPEAAAHIYLLGALVIQLILGFVYFFFTKKIMSKKLNLV